MPEPAVLMGAVDEAGDVGHAQAGGILEVSADDSASIAAIVDERKKGVQTVGGGRRRCE